MQATHRGIERCAQFVRQDRTGIQDLSLVARELLAHCIEIFGQPVELRRRVRYQIRAGREISLGHPSGRGGDDGKLPRQRAGGHETQHHDDRDRGGHQRIEQKPVGPEQAWHDILRVVVLPQVTAQFSLVFFGRRTDRVDAFERGWWNLLFGQIGFCRESQPHAQGDEEHHAQRKQAHAYGDPSPQRAALKDLGEVIPTHR